METEAAAREKLKRLFGEDEKQIKMLTCMLVCAAKQYTWYKKTGISDDIFYATMRCFTRFVKECKRVLKRNGTVYIADPNFGAVLRFLANKFWFSFSSPVSSTK